jgi:hypothetical protein
MPHTPDHPPASLHAALWAVADSRPGNGLVALILALLLRLLAHPEAAWLLPQDEEYEKEDDYPFDAYTLCGADPYALYPRAIGRAPHAIYVEAGLVADWILAGIRNRGMRPRRMTKAQRRHTRAARAPPSSRKKRALSPWATGLPRGRHAPNTHQTRPVPR